MTIPAGSPLEYRTAFSGGSPPNLASGQTDWRTPPYIFEWLSCYWRFSLDPAASDEWHLCERYFTAETDGLAHDWLLADGTPAVAFVNPPYRETGRWIAHAVEQRRRHGVVSVFLVPPRTDTRWWHEAVPQATQLWFLRGRIPFLRGDSGLPADANTTPSVVLVFEDPLWASQGRPVVRFVTPPNLGGTAGRDGR